jgi:MrfA Zn-binding domain
MRNIAVGEVRPSQLLWTYGPGALIDLPNLSVITMGLDRWDEARCLPVEEARLLDAVKRVLGDQVERLRQPPYKPDENTDRFSAEALIGVPVRPFPRWLRCVRCGTLAEFELDMFDIKENPYRPEDTRFVHKVCEKGNGSDAVPARFLLACRNGHLDDFPWRWFVHQGPSECKGILRFFEQGASMQTENLWVRCDGCSKARSLVHAFGKEAQGNLPACRGRHPHLSTFDTCTEPPRAVLLGATNSWFSMSISVLAIPQAKTPLDQLLEDGWHYFSELASEIEVKIALNTLIKATSLPGIEKFTSIEVWQAIEKRKVRKSDEQPKEADIKHPEWRVLTDPKAPSDWPHFLSSKIEPPEEVEDIIAEVLLLQRLREVNALIGFTRVEAPEESDDPDDRPVMASLCRNKPAWVPASEVHGEGIFIRFKEIVLQNWESRPSVKKRHELLTAGHQGWRNARQLDPAKGYPGIRFAALHTFSHLLIREFALECGYNAASIRERIYADNDPAEPMAGLLLYTAAADSDGTLGGLVELGKPENLGRLIRQALRRGSVCSSDPLCSEHNPASDRSLHGASCHACAFVAETSCERSNRYLDRSLLVKTFDCGDAALFPDALTQ